MTEDEQEIRELPVKWMAATRAGDVDALLDLMTGDALFLTPGNAPMDRTLFREIASGQSGNGMPEFDAESEVQEVKVMGDHAFMWTNLRVTVTPHDGGPVARSGHTMTILRKESGKWLLARDANLLVTEKNASASPPAPAAARSVDKPGFPELDPHGLMKGFPLVPFWRVWEMDGDGHVVAIAGQSGSKEEADARLEECQRERPDKIFEVQETRTIVPDRTLPTASQIRQICELLHRAFVTIRNLGYNKEPETIASFSDMIENLPTNMYDERFWDWNMLEYAFMNFEKNHPGKSIFPYARMVREIRYGAGAGERGSSVS